MQTQPKTRQQLLKDRADFVALIQNPNTPSDEKNMYHSAVAQIDRQLEAAQQPAARPMQRPQPAPAGERPAIRKVVAMTGTVPQNVTISAPAIADSLRRITIEWGEGETETLTEGKLNSKFKTCLRDLVESAKWQQRRFDECRLYMAYQRGGVYYSAICSIWPRQPSATDLDVPNAYKEAFNFVTANYSQP